jgi:hypothetical protein
MNTFYKLWLLALIANTAVWAAIIGIVWHFVAKFW